MAAGDFPERITGLHRVIDALATLGLLGLFFGQARFRTKAVVAAGGRWAGNQQGAASNNGVVLHVVNIAKYLGGRAVLAGNGAQIIAGPNFVTGPLHALVFGQAGQFRLEILGPIHRD